ncbi:hypothetical protein HDU89_007443, partial [Geranomyces variabilis]
NTIPNAVTNNTDANQLKLLTALVNTVIIGNYSATTNNKIVPGILQTATINGTTVNLAPFFSGAGKTTNRNGVATTMNFLDGGGGAPLANNTAATDTSSNQYTLVNHLYQYFGYLLQCSLQGTAGFPAYSGSTSMYTTHKFMNLRNEDVTYFIQQVGAAASSFGVSDADVNAVAASLASNFGVSCAPKTAIPSSATADLQSICTASDCPQATTPDCSLYTSGALSLGPSVSLVALGALSVLLMI